MKKIGLVFLALVIGLAGIGAAMACWWGELNIHGDIDTGTLQLCIEEGSVTQKDIGPDWTCDPGFGNIRPVLESKDIGSTVTVLRDANADGCLDKLSFYTNNGYPCYYNHIDFWTIVTGTIPLKIDYIDVTFEGQTTRITSNQSFTWNNAAGEPIFEFRWGDNFGVQQDHGDETNMSFDYHILQAAAQATEYNVYVTMHYVQWNCTEPVPTLP